MQLLTVHVLVDIVHALVNIVHVLVNIVHVIVDIVHGLIGIVHVIVDIVHVIVDIVHVLVDTVHVVDGTVHTLVGIVHALTKNTCLRLEIILFRQRPPSDKRRHNELRQTDPENRMTSGIRYECTCDNRAYISWPHLVCLLRYCN